MQKGESEKFAARLRMLKNRADISFEELAKRTGAGSSTLHRYCSGAKLPSGFGVVHAFGKACGASGEELRDLHRLWAVADAARSSPAEDKAGGPSTGTDGEPGTNDTPFTGTDGEPGTHNAPSSGADGAADTNDAPSRGTDDVAAGRTGRSGPRGRRGGLAVVVAAVLATAAVTTGAVWLTGGEPGPPGVPGGRTPTVTSATVRIHNVEGDCGKRTERVPACSMGLARDPRLSYDAGNVVSRRVWHDDRLRADCVLYDGERVSDETGVGTTRWFRVAVAEVPGGVAWLPAVRTLDHPALPTCE
jgi:hypothetical protein